MADERREQLDALLERRDTLRENVSNIKGRLTAAREDQEAVENECKKRKVAPDQLDGAIQQLEERYDQEVGTLTQGIEAAEGSMKPFLELTET